MLEFQGPWKSLEIKCMALCVMRIFLPRALAMLSDVGATSHIQLFKFEAK